MKKLFTKRLYIIFSLFISFQTSIIAQESITQIYIDTFKMRLIDSLNVTSFKNRLLKNLSLNGRTKYYADKNCIGTKVVLSLPAYEI